MMFLEPSTKFQFTMVNWNLVDGSKNIIGVVHEDLINDKLEQIDQTMVQLRDDLNANRNMMSAGQVESVEDELYRLQRHKQRILDIAMSRMRCL